MIRKRKTHVSFIVFLSVTLDFLMVGGALAAAYSLRFHTQILPPPSGGVPAFRHYLEIMPLLGAVLVFWFSRLGLYSDTWNFSNWSLLTNVAKGALLYLFTVMSLSFAYRSVSYSRLVFFLAFPATLVPIYVQKLLLSALQTWLFKALRAQRTLLIAGNTPQAVKLFHAVQAHSRWGYRVEGFLLEEPDPDFAAKYPVKGQLRDLSKHLAGVDELIVAVPEMKREKLLPLLMECEHNLVSFKIIPDVFEMITNRVEVTDMVGTPVLGLKDIRLHHLRWRFVKRAFDLFFGSLFLLVSLPLWLVIALAIKLDSRGPVFFTQERCGQNRRLFRIIKFRTMRTDAETVSGPVWAVANDPRCTRLGAFLRRTNLDELPQLLNVLVGNMSLVGPRPERPHFVEKFKYDIPQYMYRHVVKSGMTGWAQVNGLRGNTPLEDRIRYDLYYIENWTVFFDLKILFLTFFARRNAY